ncbi:MAG: hypothetical protein ACI379_15225 [Nocardioides sp.]|uniref:hypothetical protein n=1 Tax=Nocardioides sp. TaxID=35761 RepID=UPI003F06A4E4
MTRRALTWAAVVVANLVLGGLLLFPLWMLALLVDFFVLGPLGLTDLSGMVDETAGSVLVMALPWVLAGAAGFWLANRLLQRVLRVRGAAAWVVAVGCALLPAAVLLLGSR